MLCLGIESSCDETAFAFVEDGHLLDQVLASQVPVHSLFGGVVPELASREHYRYASVLFDDLLARTGKRIDEIDLVSVSRGPGLLGSLLVGVAFAKGLALGSGIPLLGINHLHAHLLAAGLDVDLRFPCLGLLVSGGHTNIYHVVSPSSFDPLGRTLDDAAGEVFDKIASFLGIPYPGGKLLDELARYGHADPDLLPRPYLHNDNLDFSFSGLKTAAVQCIEQAFPVDAWPRPLRKVDDAPQELKDFCASFNLAVVETISVKIQRAFEKFPSIDSLILAGGVAANTLLRENMAALMEMRGGTLFMPRSALCTDNAAMVAYAGYLLGTEGAFHLLDMETVPRGKKMPDDMLFRIKSSWATA